jgi:DNA polymerase-3 subunit epsilon
MSTLRTRAFWLWLAAAYAGVIALLAGAVLLLGAVLSPEERGALHAMIGSAGVVLFYGALVLLAVCGGCVQWLMKRYPVAIRQLAEQTQALQASAGQLAPPGGSELRELADAIGQLASRWRQTETDFAVRSAEERARVEEERDRFAALMSELVEGVLVCNADGRILLYNARAAALLAPESGPDGAPPAGARYAPLGLGRSVFGLFDREQVAHALDKIHQQFERDVERPHTRFVAASPGGRPLHVRAAPFLAAGRRVAGMVFTLDDAGHLLAREGQRLKLLQSLATGLRAPAANLRAAAESLAGAPDMPESQRDVFVGIVVSESRVLTERLDAALSAYGDALKGSLTLEDMRVTDLFSVAQQRLTGVLGLHVNVEATDPGLWVRVDSFAVLQAIGSLAARVHADYAIGNFRLRAAASGGFAEIDLVWSGTVMSSEVLLLWENEPMRAGGDETPLTLKDVMERHGGEVWYQVDRPRHAAWFRLLLPRGEPAAVAPAAGAAAPSRPEYYDFDLFESFDMRGELAQRPLAALAYTVFDTETTGLQPSAGDEIISIGAVRIVNSRLLRQEVFEQLVDPRRPIDRASVRVHGIEAAALAGQPTIEEVLPRFHRFCEDTVLVGHNAAFDLRFLELKESSAGVRFDQPVLDTLLLSAIVHPSQESHDLDAIAARLGVRVIGRHTALGDALVTGEVFLRLVPLLAAKGIATLGQALEASRATYLARLQY